MIKPETKLTALPNTPLWRVRDAAAVAGISPKAFLAGASRSDIPIEILKVGRLRYVRSIEFIRWLRPTAAPPTEQPARDCFDLF